MFLKGKGNADHPKKTPFKPKEPDVFQGESAELLRTFIFQCQVYFNACRADFTDDVDRINFAISYLRGPALAFFEPLVNDGKGPYDFFEKWDAFIQKLANNWGSYAPEDDDEDAITAIAFPHDGKAMTYFIEFTKYQNHIQWDE